MFASRLIGRPEKVCWFLDSEWPQAFFPSSTGVAIRRRADGERGAAAAAASRQAVGIPAAEEDAGIQQNFPALFWSQRQLGKSNARGASWLAETQGGALCFVGGMRLRIEGVRKSREKKEKKLQEEKIESDRPFDQREEGMEVGNGEWRGDLEAGGGGAEKPPSKAWVICSSAGEVRSGSEMEVRRRGRDFELIVGSWGGYLGWIESGLEAMLMLGFLEVSEGSK
ncbi:hypothetical protein V8C34DRAFT_11202 [Trichoderma compactum]